MNANYLFDLCNYNDTVEHAAGLDIALAKYMVDHPLPDGETEGGLMSFWNDHDDKLTAAYAKHDRKHFAEIVDQLAGQTAKPET